MSRGATVMVILGLAVVGFIALVAKGSVTPAERLQCIEASCDREFGRGTEASQRCQIGIIAAKMGDAEQARMRRAASGQ